MNTAPAAIEPALTPRWIQWLIVPARPSGRRATFWAPFLLLFLVTGLWAVSNPLMASVDEPAHVIKAAATVRGASDQSLDGAQTGIGTVEVPQLFREFALIPNCFAFQSEVPFACRAGMPADTESLTLQDTSAINYNPLYYAVVGWPALFPSGQFTAYLMRLMTALVSSALIAFGVHLASRFPARRWIGLALLLCLTPTLVNLLGSINPQAFEVAGAILLWVALLGLLRYPDPTQTRLRLIAMVVATIPLANARSLGPLMVLVILGLSVLSAPLRRSLDLLKDRRAWWAASACALACAASIWWTISHDTVPVGSASHGIAMRDNLEWTLGQTSHYLEQMFQALGWLDVVFPPWTVHLIFACMAILLFVAWSLGTFRDRVVLSLTAGAVFALPIASHLVQANKIGFFWQGRYAFPIAIGLALLAACAVGHRDKLIPAWLSINLIMTTTTAAVIVYVVTFYVNMHRYASGISGSWLLPGPLAWIDVPASVLTILYATAWIGAAVAVLRAVNAPDLLRQQTKLL